MAETGAGSRGGVVEKWTAGWGPADDMDPGIQAFDIDPDREDWRLEMDKFRTRA